MEPMEISQEHIKIFQDAVKENSSYDFSNYSINSLKRRLEKIVEEYDFNFDQLILDIKTNDLLREKLIKNITVQTTELFRNKELWHQLLHKLLPQFREKSSLNIWHVGCSTGQEVYSMMILLDQLGLLEKANIYASDINTDALDVAREGSYNLRFHRDYMINYKSIFETESNGAVSNYHDMSRYFHISLARDEILMSEFLRNKPVFDKMDLVKDNNPYNVKYDIIMCRNVIIYFNSNLQNKTLKLFHRNLTESGHLILGMHESIVGPWSSFFKNEKYYFRRKEED